MEYKDICKKFIQYKDLRFKLNQKKTASTYSHTDLRYVINIKTKSKTQDLRSIINKNLHKQDLRKAINFKKQSSDLRNIMSNKKE